MWLHKVSYVKLYKAQCINYVVQNRARTASLEQGGIFIKDSYSLMYQQVFDEVNARMDGPLDVLFRIGRAGLSAFI